MAIRTTRPGRSTHSTIAIVIAFALLALQASGVLAEDASKVPPQVKVIADTARKLSGYYSSAKSAFETGLALAEALGFIEPNDADAKFKELHDQLLTVAGGISWQETKNFLDEQRGPAIRAIRNLKRDHTAVRGSVDDQDSGNAAETVSLGGAAFYRPFDDRVTAGRWTQAIEYEKSELDVQTGDLVYDWRLGIPALLEVISYRLQFIAAIDPEFRNDDLYDEEIESYRRSLEAHYQKMLDGIKCARNIPEEDCLISFLGLGCRTPLPAYDFACADIRTGIEAIAETLVPPQVNVEGPTVATLRSQVMRTMPLFEVKAMIDLLHFYQTSEHDLTDLNERIPAFSHTDLCLDVKFGDPAAATPIWLYPCNSTDAQRWIYDRRSATIRNPAFDKCLDVQWANPVPGTPVWTWDCHGGEAQRWTYSHQTHRLENALGTALQIQPRRPWWWFPFTIGSSIQAESPVGTWSLHDGRTQQWLADQTVCTHSVCEIGSALAGSCDACVARVCELDAYCCTAFWDGQCVSEAESLCGSTC